jgi:Outer membrane protein
MKKIISIITLAAVSAVAYANPVIYVVDINQIHQHYYKTKAVTEQFKSTVDTTNVELQRMAEQLKVMEAEVQAISEKSNNPALSDAAKKEIIEKELGPKYTQAQALANTMQGIRNQAAQKLQQKQKEVAAAHRKEIVDVIEKIAKDKKADFVIEKNFVYSSKPTSDITEEIIAALNANAPKN